MIDKQDNITYNNDYLVITTNNNLLLNEGLSYSFNSVITMNNTIDDMNFICDFIIKNNYIKIIFVDYITEYYEIMNRLNGKYEISFIFTKSISSLCEEDNYNEFTKIIEFYNQKISKSIAFLDKNFYVLFKDKYSNIYHILLDIPNNKKYSSQYIDDSVGILSDLTDSKHSSYNQLSAVKMLDMTSKICHLDDVSKSFIKLFDIKYQETNLNNIYNENLVNLYINFTNSNPLVFIKSIDNLVPCIVGNNCFLNDKLDKLLVVRSDDDINEIKDKIKFISKNRELILKECHEYRKEYTLKSINSIEKFVGYKKQEEKKYEKDVTIVVPVYNTQDYIAKCLDSIINAIIPNCEILIINDGSTDDSEEIINKYVNNYPDTIRYIKQENRGLGNVRNVALKEAKGKYIASIDSDDSVNKNFFQEAKPFIDKNIDIIIYDWLTVTDKGKFNTSAIEGIFNDINKYEGLLYSTIMPSTCNKIIKKSLFDDLDIKYIEDKYEDLSTNPFIMLKANTIKYINKPYYEYYIRSSSIMRSSSGYSMIDVLSEFDRRLNKYNNIIKINEDNFKFYTYSWRIEEYIFNQMYNLDEKELSNYINYIYDNLYEIVCDIFSMDKYKKVLLNLKNEKDKLYIENRNKLFVEKKLTKYIIESVKNDNYFKLTPSIIYYGE